MADKPKNWAEMTPEQKRSYRLENFRKSGENIKFVSPEAEKAYNIRVKRFIDVYNVKEPDRVPIDLPVGNLPLLMHGLNTYTAMYEPEKALEAFAKFNEKYAEELEYYAAPMGMSGEALDILDYKLYAWPDHGTPKDALDWQFIEGEYMTADEYDDLIRDPTDFWLRKYLPRCFGSFKAFGMFQPFTKIVENVDVNQMAVFSMPEVRDMLHKMLDAGEAFQKFNAITGPAMAQSKANGHPMTRGGFCKAPFDTLGDTLRGTTNIMMDMFRRPEKLLEAIDVIADISISNILNSPDIDNMLMAMFPLHKGADGWMSQQQFDTFYWPPLRKVINAFIEEGLIVTLFAEGSYETRLDSVNEFPKGTVLWYFDRTDMAKAKKALGKDCCIQGNVPSSLIVTGKPENVTECCRKLIEDCGPGGGFILATGCRAENPKLENLQAMVETVNKYGYY